jgi:hypothetical protein
VDDLAEYFVQSFPHEQILSWFDDEIRTFFGVDVLEGRFLHQKGYQTYAAPRADVLLLRLEDLSQRAPEAFHEFLGIEDVELGTKNVGSEKYYADIYRRFLRQISFPEPLLDRIYGSRMMPTLYSPGELAAFRCRWSAH